MRRPLYSRLHGASTRRTDARDSRFDGLHAEAKAAVGYSANTLRSVRERYREAYSEASALAGLRDALDADGLPAARHAPHRP